MLLFSVTLHLAALHVASKTKCVAVFCIILLTKIAIFIPIFSQLACSMGIELEKMRDQLKFTIALHSYEIFSSIDCFSFRRVSLSLLRKDCSAFGFQIAAQ